MMYLDKRLKDFQILIDDYAPTSQPVILLLDNLNLYHGNRRHHRLFKILGPKMWNFTVRGLLAPCLSEIEHLFKSSETVEKSQQSIKNMQAKNMFIGRFLHNNDI